MKTEVKALDVQMEAPDFWSDAVSAQKVARHAADLRSELEHWEGFLKEVNDLKQVAELAEKEMEELSILKTYLPPEISDEDLLRIIKDGIREAGTTDVKDFAKVMKVIMPTLKGKASGDRISRALKSELEKND